MQRQGSISCRQPRRALSARLFSAALSACHVANPLEWLFISKIAYFKILSKYCQESWEIPTLLYLCPGSTTEIFFLLKSCCRHDRTTNDWSHNFQVLAFLLKANSLTGSRIGFPSSSELTFYQEHDKIKDLNNIENLDNQEKPPSFPNSIFLGLYAFL